MSRQIVLDVETTGLYSAKGDRVIEIGIVEIVDRQITGEEKSFYINPERRCSTEAIAIHGLTDEFLSKQPRFFEIVDDFIDFINGAQLIIHNAPFDLGFLEVEFALLNRGPFSQYYLDVFDTLKYARERFPGKRCSLDALCSTFGVSSSHRIKHGALLDAKLLAEIYLCLTRGQKSLDISVSMPEIADFVHLESSIQEESVFKSQLSVFLAKEHEVAEHNSILESISSESFNPCVWLS